MNKSTAECHSLDSETVNSRVGLASQEINIKNVR